MLTKLFTLFILSAPIVAAAQDTAKTSARKIGQRAEINNFYYFEIPSSINGSFIDPSPTSNISSSFTDTKLAVKIAFPTFFKDAPATENLSWSGFIAPFAKATAGTANLFKSGSPGVEYGLTGGVSKVLRHRYWVFLDDTTRHSSEGMFWLNLLGSVDRSNLSLFTPAAVYDQLIDKRVETNGSIFLTINSYFFSRIKRYKIENHIASVGLGWAKTNNYSSLKKRTYETGALKYSPDGSTYQAVTETTAGANGPLIIYRGLTGYVELFLPLMGDPKFGRVFFGNRLTYYGIGRDANIMNGTTGFYFNVKDKKLLGDKPAKDIVNFSITGQFNQLNNTGVDDYFKNNFSLMLQASLPLRLN